MAKRRGRIKDNIVTGALKPPATPAPTFADVDRSEPARLSAGMSGEQWNAAIRFQCAVRDRIDRPVSLVDALNFGRALFAHAPDRAATEMRRQFDDAKRIEQETKNAARDAEKRMMQ